MQDEITVTVSSKPRRGPNFATLKVSESTQPQYPFSTLFIATCEGHDGLRFAVGVRTHGVRRDGVNEDRWEAITGRIDAFLVGALQAASADFIADRLPPHILDDSALVEQIKWLLDAPIEQVRGS